MGIRPEQEIARIKTSIGAGKPSSYQQARIDYFQKQIAERETTMRSKSPNTVDKRRKQDQPAPTTNNQADVEPTEPVHVDSWRKVRIMTGWENEGRTGVLLAGPIRDTHGTEWMVVQLDGDDPVLHKATGLEIAVVEWRPFK